jgi:hypothetical protein
MHEHLTRELFRAISGGWRNPGDLAAIALAHLFELCPSCRREFESWRQELDDVSSVPEGADYEAVIEGIRARVEELPFAARRMILNLALVRLELGRIYAAQARLAEAGELADQAASTFADIGLPGKEAEALRLGSYAAHG